MPVGESLRDFEPPHAEVRDPPCKCKLRPRDQEARCHLRAVGWLKTVAMKNLSTAVVGTGFIGPVHVEGVRCDAISAVTGILVASATMKSQAAALRQLGDLAKAYRDT